MKQVFRKLKQKAGETLVEVLCAILIFTLSSVGMYSMVMTANNINAEAKKKDQEIQQQMIVCEKGDGQSTSGTVTMIITNGRGNATTVIVPVEIYGNIDGELYSYFKAGTGGAS